VTDKNDDHHDQQRSNRIRAFAVRLVTTLAGIALFIYGLIAAFSPLPLGAPLVIVGLFMIAGANPAFRPVIRRMRRRWPWFDKLVRAVATRAGVTMRTVIEETDPEGQDERPDEKSETEQGEKT
jgi:hypothetical protein